MAVFGKCFRPPRPLPRLSQAFPASHEALLADEALPAPAPSDVNPTTFAALPNPSEAHPAKLVLSMQTMHEDTSLAVWAVYVV